MGRSTVARRLRLLPNAMEARPGRRVSECKHNASVEIIRSPVAGQASREEKQMRMYGVVLDLSLRHCGDGQREADVVKTWLQQTLEFFTEDDVLYLYGNDSICEKRGEIVACITRHKVDGLRLKTASVLSQMLSVLNDDCDMEKVLLYVSNRFSVEVERDIEHAKRLNPSCEFWGIVLHGPRSEVFDKFWRVSADELTSVLLKENNEKQ